MSNFRKQRLKHDYIGILIRKRIEKGFTERQLQEKANIPQYKCRAIENGNTKHFSLHDLRLYLNALDLKLGDVFCDIETYKEEQNA